ncbi:hypothetical protein FKM82_005868 [Ascaphus truei]
MTSAPCKVWTAIDLLSILYLCSLTCTFVCIPHTHTISPKFSFPLFHSFTFSSFCNQLYLLLTSHPCHTKIQQLLFLLFLSLPTPTLQQHVP